MESSHRVQVLLKINPLGSLLHSKSVLSSLNGTEHQQTLSVICGFSDQQLLFDAQFLQAYTWLFKCKVVIGFSFFLQYPFAIFNTTEKGSHALCNRSVCMYTRVCVRACVCAHQHSLHFFFKKGKIKIKDLSLTATKHFVPFNICIKLFLRYARLYLAESVFKVLICNGPQLAGHNG